VQRLAVLQTSSTTTSSSRVDRTKYQIQIPLPPKIDPSVTMMTVEEKPDVTYSDIGGSKEQIEKMREVVELPMLHPEKFVKLGIDPPKGVLMYGPPGTGKTLLARAVANRTDACFIRVIGRCVGLTCLVHTLLKVFLLQKSCAGRSCIGGGFIRALLCRSIICFWIAFVRRNLWSLLLVMPAGFCMGHLSNFIDHGFNGPSLGTVHKMPCANV
jgi:hypothetical protein